MGLPPPLLTPTAASKRSRALTHPSLSAVGRYQFTSKRGGEEYFAGTVVRSKVKAAGWVNVRFDSDGRILCVLCDERAFGTTWRHCESDPGAAGPPTPPPTRTRAPATALPAVFGDLRKRASGFAERER